MKIPVALTRRGWGFLAAAVGLLLLWMILQLRDIWYLVAFFGSLPTLALLWALVIPLFAHLQVRLDGPADDLSVGDKGVFIGTVTHGLNRALQIELDWDVDGESYASALSVPGHHAMTSAVSIYLGRRGLFKAAITALRVSDPLGLVVRTVGTDANREILVLPVPLESVSGSSRRRDDGGPRTVASLGALTDNPGTPAGSVRDYRSGDAPRQIHWKQSARQGQLLVNLFEPDRREDRTLLLITDRACYGSTNEFEIAVSATATIALDWIDSGRSVKLQIGDGDLHGCRTRIEALRHLALAQMVRPSAAVESGSPAEPDGLVVGALVPRLDTRLRSIRFRGILWVIHDGPFARKQAPWQQYRILPVRSDGRG
ncbi:MAG: DUF58 domain-containing protein [Scrofimicrobium sp.]